jgi:ATP-binding protein involved in chromosome partitioning
MVDPRISVIDDRMRKVGRIIAVSSGKGGVGKSLLASTLALILAGKGYSTGLFDLDFTSPSTHVILGLKETRPLEDRGIIPPVVHGLKYMTIIYYSGGRATPLRGIDFSNAFIELLSVTDWGELDFLILDMPPGIGDATLDVIRLMRKPGFLIVTTPSPLAFETVKKLIGMLRELDIPIVGVVENMKTGFSNIQQEYRKLNVKFLGEIPYDPAVEENLGNVDRLLKTVFAKEAEKLLEHLTG